MQKAAARQNCYLAEVCCFAENSYLAEICSMKKGKHDCFPSMLARINLRSGKKEAVMRLAHHHRHHYGHHGFSREHPAAFPFA